MLHKTVAEVEQMNADEFHGWTLYLSEDADKADPLKDGNAMLSAFGLGGRRHG